MAAAMKARNEPTASAVMVENFLNSPRMDRLEEMQQILAVGRERA